MSFLSTWLLKHVFTALLPPLDPTEEDYYTRLGLESRKVTADEIRKAFRKQSLQWHPDKLAQRAEEGVSVAEAAAKFQSIREAHQVLSDPQKRQTYHAWNCSVARYQFVSSDSGAAWQHPATLFQNLTAASIRDKSRLVAVIGVLLLVGLLPFILLCAKLNQTLDGSGGLRQASWAAVLTPVWIVFGLGFVWDIVVIFSSKHVSLSQMVGILERGAWLTCLVLLCQVWDDRRTVTNWHALSIAFYFALAFRLLASVVWMGMLQEEINKMITADYLATVEPVLLRGGDGGTRSLEDLTEDELVALHKRYTIVEANPDQMQTALEILRSQDIDLSQDAAALEAVKVQCSMEYQAAADQVGLARLYAVCLVIFGLPLIPLVAAKLQGTLSASWWVVALPVWLYLGLKLVRSCVLCGCSDVGSQDVIIVDAEANGENEAEAENEAVADEEMETPPEEIPIETKAQAKAPSLPATTPTPTPLETVDEDAAATASHSTPIKEEADPGPPTYGEEEVDVLSEAPSDEGAWRESLPKDPPGLTAEQELERQEWARRRALFTAAEKARASASSPAASPPTASPDNDDNNSSSSNNNDNNTEEPAFDEDMFRQWQRMQEEADSSAMEAQAKAQWLCCSTCFQLIMVCLIVGKLEQDYPRPTDGSVGFSAFWILFPVFLLAGVILCCCSVLVFQGGDVPADETGAEDDVDENGDENAADGSPMEVDIFQAAAVSPPSMTTSNPTADVEAPAPAAMDDWNELD